MSIYEEAQALLPDLTHWRRTLHKHAEGAYELSQTLDLIRAVLTEHGAAFTEPAKSTIVCDIGQGTSGMILRADTDALAMEEKSGLDFATETNWAHNCGHDLHTAMLLGAAVLLQSHADALSHRTRLIFQPDEEGATGALHAIEHCLLDGAWQGAFALHVSPVMESGVLYYSNDTLYATADEFRIDVLGQGAHGAAPHTGHDPIFCAVQIYNALQGLISRETPALSPAVISVCAINAGATYNVLPERAELRGTVRTYDENLRQHLKERVLEIARAVAPACGCTASARFVSGVPSVDCDETLNACILRQLNTACPEVQTRLHSAPFSWSEDFGYFKSQLPITMMTLGAQVPGHTAGIHTPDVHFDEFAMPAGVCAHVCAALSV